MRRGLAFVIVLLTAALVQRSAGGEAGVTSTALAIGFALIAAALAGSIVEVLRLPRVTGYLLFGLACGPYVANLITRSMARDLQLLNSLAVVLIAFVAGLEINLASLRPRMATLLRFSAASLGSMYVVLFVLLWAAWPLLGIAPEADGAARLTIVAVLATLVVSFSPTVTMAVVAEARAEGRFTEFVVALVILADLVLIIGFTLVLQLARVVFSQGDGERVSLMARLAWEIPGSLAFGALLGALFALYLRYVGREITLGLLVLCVLVGEVGEALHFEAVVAALAAGLVVENVAPPEGNALKEAVEKGALPVLIVFFAAAGASLQLDALATVGVTAIGLSLARLAIIYAGAWAGMRFSRIEPESGSLVWMGLVSQAGVTLGLTMIVSSEFPEWGQPIQTIIVSLTALHQLVGPALLKLALNRAGEVGALDEAAPEPRPAAAPIR